MYSIVARDAQTGEFGVTVQSNYFSVGPDVAWTEPVVGAIATQAIAEVGYGPRRLELMAAGVPHRERSTSSSQWIRSRRFVEWGGGADPSASYLGREAGTRLI
jgi:uncharacterized Ntn-hydrolase superfamily protein